MSNADRIISELRTRPSLDDDELARRIGTRRQAINQVCRVLVNKGLLIREIGPKGKIVNRLRNVAGAREPLPSRGSDGSMIAAPSGSFAPVSNTMPRVTSTTDEKRMSTHPLGASIQIGGHQFELLCEIEPVRKTDGTIAEFLPQSRYVNAQSLGLNRYGRGPFCKFSIPNNRREPGVYAVMLNGRDLKYIGETENLSDRFNMGYGNISPRNCFARGQETNCRLNNAIYCALAVGVRVVLWFHATKNFKAVEYDLRVSLKREWNRV